MIRVRNSDGHDMASARIGVTAAAGVVEREVGFIQVMKMMELPVQAFEFMIALTVLCRYASPTAIKACTCEKSQGLWSGGSPVHVMTLVGTDPGVIRNVPASQISRKLAEVHNIGHARGEGLLGAGRAFTARGLVALYLPR